MRLIFSVLWFDDSEEYFDSLDMDQLRQEVLSWGFYPEIICVTTPEEFEKYSPFQRFDLIVVDQNLENYPAGQEFISNIRTHAVYTEIIFYTAGIVSNLWEAIGDKKLEGIFVSHRSEILSKISKVGHQSIRKILDLENMRGIVMAEVGELDHLLDEIITTGIEYLPPDQQSAIYQKFHNDCLGQQQTLANCLEEFGRTPNANEMIALCDSNKRWRNFNRLWKQHPKLKGGEKVGNYEAEILIPRNFLAHGKPEIQNDGYCFRFQGKEFFYNEEVSSNLRKKILAYKEDFANILRILNN